MNTDVSYIRTESAFSGEYNDYKGKGVYKCACCGEELFSSDDKYSSGSGWPSFWQPINEKKMSVNKRIPPSG